MNITFIGFLAFSFIGLTLINRVLEGAFLASADITVLNQLTIFRELELFGLFSVPVPNLSLITEGLPHLVMWDYTFFGGNAGIIQYFLYSVTAAMSFGLFLLVLGMLYQYFNRVR